MLLFSFVVTTQLHRFRVACMARDRLVSVGRTLTIFGFWRGANCPNVHLARLVAGVQKGGLDVHDISLASGSANVLGYGVSPANACCSGKINGYHVFAQSHGRSLRAVALAVGRWSSSMVTSLFWRSAIVVLSQSLMRAGV